MDYKCDETRNMLDTSTGLIEKLVETTHKIIHMYHSCPSIKCNLRDLLTFPVGIYKPKLKVTIFKHLLSQEKGPSWRHRSINCKQWGLWNRRVTSHTCPFVFRSICCDITSVVKYIHALCHCVPKWILFSSWVLFQTCQTQFHHVRHMMKYGFNYLPSSCRSHHVCLQVRLSTIFICVQYLHSVYLEVIFALI